ncbi:MAG: beta-propeller repeat-containing protein [Streptosporangiaceae bacterium]|nr:beta-propeller repeat-containing protein [Streptosporangiaceae bacterium]
MLSAAVAASALFSGCRSPVPFYAQGRDPDTSVLALAGPAPYVRTDPPGPVPQIAGVRPGDRAGPSGTAGWSARVYAGTGAGMLSQAVRRLPARVWVPNPQGGTLDIIDQASQRVIGTVAVAGSPERVVPSWDLKTLWLADSAGDALVPVDPRTGRRGPAVRVPSPYDLYFTPDGRTALVMAGRLRRIDFRDPQTMRLRTTLRLPCRGVRHADFSATGAFLVASCRFSGRLVRVDPRRRRVTGVLRLGQRATPQDVRLSPDGTVFYVSDPAAGGVWLIDAAAFTSLGFIRTGPGADGLHPSRDARVLYVSNGGDGTISVIDFATRRVVKHWRLPGTGSPGMGGVSADGKVLWLSDRSGGGAYAVSTETGRLIRRVGAARGGAGVCVYPQPGRFSLGHNGNLR